MRCLPVPRRLSVLNHKCVPKFSRKRVCLACLDKGEWHQSTSQVATTGALQETSAFACLWCVHWYSVGLWISRDFHRSVAVTLGKGTHAVCLMLPWLRYWVQSGLCSAGTMNERSLGSLQYKFRQDMIRGQRILAVLMTTHCKICCHTWVTAGISVPGWLAGEAGKIACGGISSLALVCASCRSREMCEWHHDKSDSDDIAQ